MSAYHNLAGWLRDVRGVLMENERNDLAGTYLAQLDDLLGELVTGIIADEVERQLDALGLADLGQGPDESVSEELVAEDADADVAVPRRRDGPATGEMRTGPAPVRARFVGGPAPVADPLPRAVLPESRRRASGSTRVAGTRRKVSRRATKKK